MSKKAFKIVEQKNVDYFTDKVLSALTQEEVRELVIYSSTSDKVIEITKKFLPLVEEEFFGFDKKEVLISVLSAEEFQKETANFIYDNLENVSSITKELFLKNAKTKEAVEFIVSKMEAKDITYAVKNTTEMSVFEVLINYVQNKDEVLNSMIKTSISHAFEDKDKMITKAVLIANTLKDDVKEIEVVKKASLFKSLNSKLTDKEKVKAVKI